MLNNEQGMEKYFFRASAEDFKKVPGSPIAYWLSEAIISSFEKGNLISDHCATRKGMATGLNAVFVRAWHEVSIMPMAANTESGMGTLMTLSTGKMTAIDYRLRSMRVGGFVPST